MTRKPCASCFDIVGAEALVATCSICDNAICQNCRIQMYDDESGQPAGVICQRCADALVAGGHTEPATAPRGTQ